MQLAASILWEPKYILQFVLVSQHLHLMDYFIIFCCADSLSIICLKCVNLVQSERGEPDRYVSVKCVFCIGHFIYISLSFWTFSIDNKFS